MRVKTEAHLQAAIAHAPEINVVFANSNKFRQIFVIPLDPKNFVRITLFRSDLLKQLLAQQ